MKYIILLLIGVALVTTVIPDKRDLTSNSSNRTETKSTTSVEALGTSEVPKTDEKPVEPPKAPTFAELSLEEKIKANPNNCDLTIEIMYEDGTCHTKAVGSDTNSGKLIGSGDCEAEIRKIFPANEVNNAIKVMIQESSRNPAVHNYNPSTGDDSYGCFQINLAGNNKLTRPPASELIKAEVNVAFAYGLWRSVGWCSTGGWLNTGIKVGIC